MSVLACPRIHFNGKCLINAATCNNDDVVVNIDPVNVALREPLASMTDETAYDWLTAGVVAKNVNNQKLFTYIRCGWNYFGDLSTTFVGAAVSAVVGRDGPARTDDPLVGGPVRLLGSEGTTPVICDLDPTGVWLPQLFVGGITVGVPGAELMAVHDTRAFARWLTFRNAGVYPDEQAYPGFAATWQCAFPAKSVTFDLTSQSPALAALRDAMRANRGLVVQFCVYLPEPRIRDPELIELFRRKQGRANPVESFMVGTVGVLEDGELETVPAGRILQLSPGFTDPQKPTVWDGVGPAAARVHADRSVVSLNLVTTFPEATYDRPPTRKAYFGPVRLGLVPTSGGSPIAVGEPLAYGNASYLATGGIVDVPYDPDVVTRAELEAGTLVLLADEIPASPILTERDTTVTVETDDRGTYLDVGASTEIGILVRERGHSPANNINILIKEYQYMISHGAAQERAFSVLRQVEGTPGLTSRLQFPRSVVFPACRSAPLPVTVTALVAGSLVLVFTPEGQPQPTDPFEPAPTSSYAGVRILPDDDFCDVPVATRRCWAFVFKTIFRFYYLLFPAMSRVIPLNDEAAMKRAARRLVERTDPALWMSTRYMPRTRDLSTGKRALLVEWADSLPPDGAARE